MEKAPCVPGSREAGGAAVEDHKVSFGGSIQQKSEGEGVVEKCSFQGRSRIDSAAEMELLTYKYKCYEATESHAMTGFAGL